MGQHLSNTLYLFVDPGKGAEQGDHTNLAKPICFQSKFKFMSMLAIETQITKHPLFGVLHPIISRSCVSRMHSMYDARLGSWLVG